MKSMAIFLIRKRSIFVPILIVVGLAIMFAATNRWALQDTLETPQPQIVDSFPVKPSEVAQGFPAPATTASAATASVVVAASVADVALIPPQPEAPLGSIVGPQIITDSVNHFSLALSPGWFAFVPDAMAI